MFEADVQLSFEGQRRREQILRLAQQQARRRRRGQQRRKTGISAGGVVTLAFVVAWSVLLRRQHSATPPMPQHEIAITPTNPPAAPAIVIVRVPTDPTITARLAITPQRPQWRSVNDDELLRALADAGRPAGLIEFDGKAMLVPRESAHRRTH